VIAASILVSNAAVLAGGVCPVERDMIGAELHDNINQIQVGTLLLLSSIRAEGTLKETLRSCVTNLQEAINETRKLGHELVGPDFATKSLAFRINGLFESMLTARGIQLFIDLSGTDERLLSDEQKLAIYRVVQEHCINIVKHAHASRVEAVLETSGGYCRLIIIDNGIGMSAEDAASGIGMRNMRARMNVLQGSIQVITSPGKGLKLIALFPMAEHGTVDH
jgi:two-component system, NarL family, sensor kinase